MTHNRGDRLAESFWGTTRNVEEPDNVPVFADALWHDSWPRCTDAPLPVPIDFGGGNMGPFSEMNHFCIDRHVGAVNVLFMDFSARKVGLKELWTLKWHRSFNTAGPWTQAGGALPSDWPAWMRDFKDY
jgi:prepilin-type processing-associated H-X9-DG protein